jgi:hypothetical protein
MMMRLVIHTKRSPRTATPIRKTSESSTTIPVERLPPAEGDHTGNGRQLEAPQRIGREPRNVVRRRKHIVRHPTGRRNKVGDLSVAAENDQRVAVDDAARIRLQWIEGEGVQDVLDLRGFARDE